MPSRPHRAHRPDDSSTTPSTPTRARPTQGAHSRRLVIHFFGCHHHHHHHRRPIRVPIPSHRAFVATTNAPREPRFCDRTAHRASSSSSSTSSRCDSEDIHVEIFSSSSVIFFFAITPDHDWSLGGGRSTHTFCHHTPNAMEEALAVGRNEFESGQVFKFLRRATMADRRPSSSSSPRALLYCHSFVCRRQIERRPSRGRCLFR